MTEQQTKTEESVSAEKFHRNLMRGALVTFLASGGLAAYLHYAYPTPAECLSPSYRMNGPDQMEIIGQKQATINGMETVISSDGVTTTQELYMVNMARAELSDEQTSFEHCGPARDMEMYGLESELVAVASGMMSGAELWDKFRRRKREKVDIYSLVEMPVKK